MRTVRDSRDTPAPFLALAAKSNARDGKPLLARAAFARAERLQGRAVTLGALAAQARAGGAA
ncbi:hypothetical protein JMM61_17145 [Rhodovulum sulfidophilum]|uniref:hypothetical protein n=1 Tax=Rhodovulum sulfidophilum TaxID=35806 RepID=UPI001926D3DB|nr:hypothetical protein [Rhodovulum sulfidophilum]MBL3587086.1 hypothetical protein [Rhodovulum sulfidophilum]